MNIALIGYEANVKNRVGSNQYAFELMKALYHLDKKNNYLVYLPTPPLPDLPPERKNWRYKVVGPAKFWNFIGLPWALFQQKPKPDIVFNPGHYAPLFCPAPSVISIMDLGFLRFPEQFTKPIFWKLKFFTRYSARKADHILAISEFTRDDIISTYQIGPEKVTATPLGYDKDKYNQAVNENQGLIKKIKGRYGISGKYILYLGTLKPSKNIEGLLEAFKKLKIQKLKLVVAGRKGWLYGKIYQKAKDLGIEEKVVFTGFVDDWELPGLIAGAEVYVLPSFWEGFGIPVLYAMAVGTPVVVSNVASLPEVVGEAGILVDPNLNESIARGIKRALSKKKELTQKGLKQVKKFSWQKCARETLKIFEKLA